jgi:hypothetical protein
MIVTVPIPERALHTSPGHRPGLKIDQKGIHANIPQKIK